MQRFSRSEANLLGELEEEKAALLKQCEQKATLLKQCEEQKATLLEQCEQKDTLLKWYKEQITMSFEQSEKQKAAFLSVFEQEKAELRKQRDKHWEYWERVDKCIEKLKEAPQRHQEKIDQTAEQNPDIFDTSLWAKRARRTLEDTVQIHGALRFIVERASQNKIIQVSPEAEIQEGLDKLARTPEFTTILQQEVKARGLGIDWVMKDFHHIEYELWRPLSFNGGPITIREADFIDSDRAILVTLLKVQSNWPHPLKWTEETYCKKGK